MRSGEPLVRAIKLSVDHDPVPGQFVLTGCSHLAAENCRLRDTDKDVARAVRSLPSQLKPRSRQHG